MQFYVARKAKVFLLLTFLFGWLDGFVVLGCFSKTGSYSVALAGLELKAILLPLCLERYLCLVSI